MGDLWPRSRGGESLPVEGEPLAGTPRLAGPHSGPYKLIAYRSSLVHTADSLRSLAVKISEGGASP